MRKIGWPLLGVILAGSLFGHLSARPPQAAGPSGYHLLKKVVLGGDGGWDYLSADPATHRVFISRGTYVMIVDADGNVIGNIPNLKGTHGAVLAPEFNVGYTSNGGSNSATMFDLKALTVIREVPLTAAVGPDGFLYEPMSKRAFFFNGRSQDTTAIDAKSGEVAGTVALGGKPEAAQADAAGHIYVNIEDKNQIMAFDAKTLAPLATWPADPCTAPGGMAIDVAHKVLYIGCHNNMMAVMDYTSGKIVGQVPIGPGVDASAFDPGTGYAFSSCGDGTITVAHQDGPGKFSIVDTIKTQAGARTMTLDTGNHRIYTVTADQTPAPAPTPDNPRPRPVNVPGTFTLLIYGR